MCLSCMLLKTSQYPEYPGIFVLGGEKIFRSGEGKGIRGEKEKKKLGKEN